MISVIIWDFDGVIIDSMEIKGRGFVELFSGIKYKEANEIIKYHYDNGGVSRFEKIKYFYNRILGVSITEEHLMLMSDKFSRIVKSQLSDKSHLIGDSVDFIRDNYSNGSFHIVSGSEHNELNLLCSDLDLDRYFISIDGSPTAKEILVKNVIRDNFYKKENVILIGDSYTDFLAAKENGIRFYGYRNEDLRSISYKYIDRFSGVNLLKD